MKKDKLVAAKSNLENLEKQVLSRENALVQGIEALLFFIFLIFYYPLQIAWIKIRYK